MRVLGIALIGHLFRANYRVDDDDVVDVVLFTHALLKC